MLSAETINDENTEFDFIPYNWAGTSKVHNGQFMKAIDWNYQNR